MEELCRGQHLFALGEAGRVLAEVLQRAALNGTVGCERGCVAVPFRRRFGTGRRLAELAGVAGAVVEASVEDRQQEIFVLLRAPAQPADFRLRTAAQDGPVAPVAPHDRRQTPRTPEGSHSLKFVI